MLKRNYFLLISLLVFMALVFGVPGGVDAKFWPQCPFGQNVDTKGPATHGSVRFWVVDEIDMATFNLRCGSNEINYTIELDWGSPHEMQETDFVEHGSDPYNLVFGLNAPDIPEFQECFNDYTNDFFCLQFMNVHKLVETEYELDYSVEVILLRAIQPRH